MLSLLTLRDEFLNQFVYLCWLLRLAAACSKNDIATNCFWMHSGGIFTYPRNQAHLLREYTTKKKCYKIAAKYQSSYKH